MTDDEICEDMKRMSGNDRSIANYLFNPSFCFYIDPATKYIYDVPSYVEMLLPMLRADGQVTFFLNEKYFIIYNRPVKKYYQKRH
jgi:hypothetical protein